MVSDTNFLRRTIIEGLFPLLINKPLFSLCFSPPAVQNTVYITSIYDNTNVYTFIAQHGMMDVSLEGFDWDEANTGKCQSHGVLIREIEKALASKTLVIMPDMKHSKDEGRYIAICQTAQGRDIFIVFTFRIVAGRKLLRPITARYMHRKEAERYGKTNTEI